MVLALLALILTAPFVTAPGAVRWTLQVLGAVAIGVLAVRSFRRILGSRPTSPDRDASKSSRRRPRQPGRWEDVDALGDELRISLISRWIVGFGIVVAISLVLIIFGDSTLRVLGVVALCFSAVMLMPLIWSATSSRRRMREGRALVPGDPYRPDGIRQADTDAS